MSATLTPEQLQRIAKKTTVSYDQEMDPFRLDEMRIEAGDHERLEMKQEMAALRYVSDSSEQAVEIALQRWEQNYDNADTKKQRWAGQQRWQGKENEEMRVGRIMHAYTFIDTLRRSGVDARIDTPKVTIYAINPDGERKAVHTPTLSSARLWLNHGSNKGLVGVNAWVPDEESGRRIQKTVSTLQYPYAQEFSVMRFNQYNVPTKEKFRGWRTTLLVLIISGVLTEKEAHKAFGEPLGPAAEFYRQQLQAYRKARMGLTQ